MALGGGGARGAAHVGVLEALAQLRIPVDCIAGTSGGAIVGGLYASGFTLQQLHATFLRPDLQASMANQQSRSLLDYQAKQNQLLYLLQVEFGYAHGQFFFPEGLITGNDPGRILNVLTLVTQPGTDFNKLPIPYRAVATDIDTGDEVVLDHGSLATAMRASMSVPGVYAPVRIDNHLLVDGGLVDNLPVDVAREMGADIVIAVNVSTPLSNPQSLNNVVGVSLQVIKLLGNQNVNHSIASLNAHDVLIQPDLGDITAVDFNRADEAIRLGKQAALKVLTPLHDLQLSPQAYAEYRQQHRYTPKILKTVDFIEIHGNHHIPTAMIRSHMTTQIGQAWSFERIGRDLENLYRLGYFRQVNASIAYTGDRSGLVITVDEKPWQPNYLRFGLALQDDFEGGSQYELSFGWTRAEINQLGAKWRNQFEMGSNRRIYSEFYQPVNYSGTIFVAPHVEYQNTLSNIYNGQDLIAQYNTRYINAGFDIGGEFGNMAELRIGPSYGHVNSTPRIGEPSLPSYTNNLGGMRLRFGLDTLEGDTGFPTSGSYLTLNGFFARNAMGSNISFDKFELTGAQVFGNDSHSLILTTDVGSSLRTNIPYYDEFTLGGFLSLSGLREQQLRGQQVFAAHAIYLERIGNLPSVLGNGLYIGGSLEGGNVWGSDQNISLARLQYGGSLFIGAETALGPVYLGTGFSQSGNQTFYLFIGLPFTLN
ncbi:MAG TPA: patatin-like phospholipase family protein [Gammaproteobacteria bacterium]|nr:patatin-like phospholipase family protein [Gammaproteobacteria bacterium]